MPIVWKTAPDITARWWAATCPPAVSEPRDRRIQALGRVDNLADVLEQVRMTVAPLAFGAGLKGKVADSLAAGVPCVCSAVAAEGYALPPPLQSLVAEDAAGLAASIIRLHERRRRVHGLPADRAGVRRPGVQRDGDRRRAAPGGRPACADTRRSAAHDRVHSQPLRSPDNGMEADARNNLGVWAAFLAVCFVVLGLMGLFASYAGQIPLERAFSRLQVLDRVAAAVQAPDAAAQLAELRPLLADRAEAVLDGPGTQESRIAGERQAALAEGVAESDAVSSRVRLMLLFVTLTSCAFGIGILAMSRRS